MKHSVRITGPNGAHSYLSHLGKASFAPATARKYCREWLAANPGGIARIENQDREPVETSHTVRRLVARAPEYALADSIIKQANRILRTLES